MKPQKVNITAGVPLPSDDSEFTLKYSGGMCEELPEYITILGKKVYLGWSATAHYNKKNNRWYVKIIK